MRLLASTPSTRPTTPNGEHDFGTLEIEGERLFFQDRLLRPKPVSALARSFRRGSHEARADHHARRGILKCLPRRPHHEVHALTDGAGGPAPIAARAAILVAPLAA